MRLRRSIRIAPSPRLKGLQLQQQKRAPAISQRNVLRLIPWLLPRPLKLSNYRSTGKPDIQKRYKILLGHSGFMIPRHLSGLGFVVHGACEMGFTELAVG